MNWRNWKSGTPSGACLRNEALLEDYLEGALIPKAHWDLEAHLSNCGPCAAALENARAGTNLVRRLTTPVADPGDIFTRRVMARVRDEESKIEEQQTWWHPLETLAMRLAVSSALAVVLLVSAAAWRSNQAQAVSTSAQSFAVDRLLPDSAPELAAGSDTLMGAIAENHDK
jgi:anti-sigma factor RsiW